MTRITRSLVAAAAAAGVFVLAGAPGASADGGAEPVVCIGTIENTVVGEVTVPYNESCTLRNVVVTGSVVAELDALAVSLDGAVVVGDVVSEARRVDLRRAVVTGGLAASEASDGAVVAGSVVRGDVRLANVQHELTVGDPSRGASGNVFGGDLSVLGAYGAGAIGSNVVAGDLVVTRGAAPVAIRRNVVGGALDCSGNPVAPTGGQNVAASKLGQCAAL